MKRLLLLVVALLVLAPAAQAKTRVLKKDAADNFIAKYFPQASIPGPVSGAFVEIDKYGHRHKGFASCEVPAMGGRSDGEVSTCTLRY